MRPRFSLLNLLLVTTIVALVIVVIRLRSQLQEEKSLRAELLQHGGILQISDPNAVQVVNVTAWGERNTLRWRVYVPAGQTAIFNSRLEAVAADKPLAARLPPNAAVVGERSPSNPLNLQSGESVITIHFVSGESPHIEIEVVGEANRQRVHALRSDNGDLKWFCNGQRRDFTPLENTQAISDALASGRTLRIGQDQTLVLCRYREFGTSTKQKATTEQNRVGEVLFWIRANGN